MKQVDEIKKLNVFSGRRRAYQFAHRATIGAVEEAPKGRYPISVKHWDEIVEYIVALRGFSKAPKWVIRYEGADQPAPRHDSAEIAMEATDLLGNPVRLSFVPTK